MQPYLQAVTQNSVCVMVESNSELPVRIDYCPDGKFVSDTATTSYNVPTSKKTYVHRIILRNLTPNTVYNYKASQEQKTVDGGTFRTAVLPGQPFRFAIMGDCQSNPEIHAAIAKQIKKKSPYFSIYCGDLSDYHFYPTIKKEFFIKEELELIACFPFFNAVGNHDDWSKNYKAFTQSIPVDSANKPYYSFDYGDMHILVLSTEDDADTDSEQYKFIRNDLASTENKWKIAVFHKPAYCGGGWGTSSDMRQISTDIFERCKVDLILSGHAHFYQHNLVKGIHYLIMGGGGGRLHTPKDKNFTIKSIMEHHFGICDVNQDSLIIRIYDIKGIELDKIELIK